MFIADLDPISVLSEVRRFLQKSKNVSPNGRKFRYFLNQLSTIQTTALNLFEDAYPNQPQESLSNEQFAALVQAQRLLMSYEDCWLRKRESAAGFQEGEIGKAIINGTLKELLARH